MPHTALGTPSSTSFGSLSGTFAALVAADAFYQVDFIALNNSAVQGGAFLALDFETNQLTIITGASGVEAGQTHPQHIHGFPPGTPDANTPTLIQDTDLDGFVELAEGLPAYGPILLNIQSPPGSGLAGFPRPDGNSFAFVETYDLDDLTFDMSPTDDVAPVPLRQVLTAENLTQREIVLHGVSLKAGQGANGGEADGTAGYKVVLPIASGEIERLSGEEVALQFSKGRFEVGNQLVALDIQGNAGKAYRLFDIFDREPDQQGLSFFVEALDEGASLTSVARTFLLSQEFTMSFGALNSLSNEAFVDVLFENVLERQADAAGDAFFVNQLNQGASREAVFVAFTESAENQAQVAPMIKAGILLTESALV